MPTETDPVPTTPELYCLCRQSRADEFMICCDNCNEWYHGTCIGLSAEVGQSYDSFYCLRCRRRNRRLKSTYKSDPSCPDIPKEEPKEDRMPKTARIINSAMNRRKSMCGSLAALPEKSKAKPPAAATKPPKRGNQLSSAATKKPVGAAKKAAVKPVNGAGKLDSKPVEVGRWIYPKPGAKKSDSKPIEVTKKIDPKPAAAAKKIDPKPVEAVKKMDPKPVKKSFESKGTQCDLFRELASQSNDDQNPSPPGKSGKKRGICFTYNCDERARPESRYCSDECGSFTALTRVFASMPQLLPGWGSGSDGSRSKDLIQVLSNSQNNMLTENDTENSHVSRKSPQPTEPEKKAESDAKKAKGDDKGRLDFSSRRKSRSSRHQSPKPVDSPAKKPKLQDDLSVTKSKSSKKSKTESHNSDSESPQTTNKTTLNRRAEKRSLTLTFSKELEIIPSRRLRIESVNKTSNTLPNSPSHLPEQKTQSIQSTPRVLKILNTQKVNNTSSKAALDQNKKLTLSKTPNISQNTSPFPSPKHTKSISGTANLEKPSKVFYCEPKSENCEKMKTINRLVSQLLPEQKALLARKRMMMKIAMEQQLRVEPGDYKEGKSKGPPIRTS
ncbi:nucleolar protein dao-5 [Drosophila rhopaloa]|uniref:PHD-type domain-containing protein n=1 Tax=Drosophila rhopaloa TaxID=1041015 RepID=A0ABM5H3Y7_DRORH|nr:nucleolar protein dao-5 [Drosophila rhopaloa]